MTLRYGELDGDDFLRPLIETEFAGRIALLASFGAESALLLDLVAAIDRSVPVIFLDTGKLFAETLDYRDRLVDRLGLTDLRVIRPSDQALGADDPAGTLWRHAPDSCCALRKVAPMARAIAGFDALLSGRKRYHGALRSFMPRFEAVDGRIKIDPFANWSRQQVDHEFARRDLPRHPLEALGYASIGCAPCTEPASPGADPRSGRWRGSTKTECGIHRSGAEPAAPFGT